MKRYFLVAGIDFGTSLTKVVLRDNNASNSNALVVTFPEYPTGLLPSLVGIVNGGLTLPPVPKNVPKVPYLKMLVAHVAQLNASNRPPSKVPQEMKELYRLRKDVRLLMRDLLAYYLAYVISATKEFIRTKSNWKKFDFSPGSQKDYLLFQLAVPTGLLQDGGVSETLFRQAFIAGYALSGEVSPKGTSVMPYTTWIEMVNHVIPPNSTTWDAGYQHQCLLYPEVAAAVQTIFNAPNARDGLYITMDVGAGTIDLNAFRSFTDQKSGQRNLDYYAALVRPLGIQHLQRPYIMVDPLTDKELMQRLRLSIKNLLIQAKKHQPNLGTVQGKRTWDGARLFIFGGGSHHTDYKQNYEIGIEEADIYKPTVSSLPGAKDLKLPKGDTVNFGRFAVAYGLSTARFNLNNVKLPHELQQYVDRLAQLPPQNKPSRQLNWED